MTGTFQERYIVHQARKASQLAKVLDDELVDAIGGRHSARRFTSDPIDPRVLDVILDAGRRAPSSCDRHGIKFSVYTARDDKALLGGLLVGGVGWIHRAPAIVLLTADPSAYVAGDEITFMPYLDAGHASENMLLAARALGLGACFVNPNVRKVNHSHLRHVFTGDRILCGAIALGREVE